MNKSIPNLIHQFLDENRDQSLDHLAQFFCLEDGTLFHHNDVVDDDSAHQLCALSCGAWRASYFMGRSLNNDNFNLDEDVSSLSFGTSSDGIFILTLQAYDKRLYAGMTFQNETTPAKLKQKFKMQLFALQSFLDDTPLFDEEIKITKSNPFEGLTDREIDEAFKVAGEV